MPVHFERRRCGAMFVSAAAALVTLIPPRAAATAAAEPQLSLVIMKNQVVYVGEVIQDESAQIKFSDIAAGVDRTLDKSDISKTERGISDATAIARSNIACVTAWKVARYSRTQPTVGKVAKTADGISYLTLNAKNGLAAGQKLNVFRGAGDIIDPDTKKVIGAERPRIAQLEVVEVQETYSKAKLLGSNEVKLQVGDEVETLPLKMAVAVLPLVDVNYSETDAGVAMAETLTQALVGKHITVVERGMLFDAIKEIAIQRTDFFDAATMQKLGRQVGASMILTGKIVSDAGSNKAFIRLLNVETGEVLLAVSQAMAGPAVATGGAAAGDPGRGRVPTDTVKPDTAKPAVGAAGGANFTTTGAIKPPAEDKVIAEDKHPGEATNHPSFTRGNVYVMKIDAADPKVRLASTGLYYRALQPQDEPNTKGNVSVSIDYGKTWTIVDTWDTESTKRAKRWDHWHAVDLAKVVKKKPDTEVDELHVKFEVDGMVAGLHIEDTIWAKK